MDHKSVQQIAKDTIAYAKQIIKPGINLRGLRRSLEEKMTKLFVGKNII